MKRYLKRKENWQGMNWIRQDLRLAIYLRDGLACCYCGDAIENGAQLTLDHVKPHNLGGSNKPTNLVSCCHRCNCSRGKRSIEEFASATANYLNHNVKASDIVNHVKDCQTRNVKTFRIEAKKLIASRGSAAKVLAKMAK
jgi:5-methylcytosine-specific restriction endonuclease McrA